MTKQEAELYTTPTPEAPGYAWKWRCIKTGTDSAKAFPMYHDCLTDAVEHGYHVEPTRARGITAPGGAGYALRKRDGT